MGRSQLTTSAKLQKLANHHFGDFKRALMGADIHTFDDLMAAAKNNRMAISQSVDVLPVTAMLLTMIIELAVRIKQLEKEIRELKEQEEK